MMTWTGPFRLDCDEKRKAAPSKLGVYRVTCRLGENPKSIPRCGCDDPEGVLAIGESLNLRSRLRDFYSGTESGAGHSEGNTYFWWYSWGELFPKDSLHFEYADLSGSINDLVRLEEAKLGRRLSAAHRRRTEITLLHTAELTLFYGYKGLYGELPVLNKTTQGYWNMRTWIEAVCGHGFGYEVSQDGRIYRPNMPLLEVPGFQSLSVSEAKALAGNGIRSE